ncbi:MAG: Mpo1-like protein [Myxococcota bacterium]
MRPNLLAWQWGDYAEKHASPANVAIHLVAVPLAWVGLAGVLAGPFAGWRIAATGAVAFGLALAAQGRGHRMEGSAPAPFRGPADFVTRFLAEQLVTFPRFVISGGAARVLRRQNRPS